MESHLLIVNTHSGGGRMRERVESMLAELPLPAGQVDVAYTEGPGHATRLAREAAPTHDTLVAVGGDGTVGEVATGILTAPEACAVLAILPAGTGNDAAWTLGIPDWEAGVSALCGGRIRTIDICEVDYRRDGRTETRISLIGVGIGFPAQVTAAATKRVKRILGRWGYVYAAFACAAGYRAPKMRVEADGKVREGRFPLCAVVNMEWSGGHSLRMAPGARFDDGWLNVMVVRDPCVPRLLLRTRHVMRGTHVDLPEVDYFPAREVVVESDPRVELMIDADLAGTTPARFRILPGALRVRVPEAADGV